MDAPSGRPIRKVASAGLAGALATIIIYVLGLAGIELNDAVAAAIVTVLTFAVAWLVPSDASDLQRTTSSSSQP